MKFSDVARFVEQIEKTTSRLTMTHILADLFKKLKPDEFDKTLYLLQGRVSPLYDPVEFGMGEKMVIRSIVLALHLEKKLFESKYQKLGDLGGAVEYFKKQYKSFVEKDLSVKEVYESLYELAIKTGPKSQEAKINILASLVRQLDPLSCRYVVRIPLAVLRLGFSDMTVLDALSWMLKGDKSLRPVIEKAYHVQPDLGALGKLLKEKGEKGLLDIHPKVFAPILMMRAERLSSGEEIVKKIGKAAVEPKYDGFRLQVHYRKGKREGGEVRLFSRNLEDVSYMYPDLVLGIKKQISAGELIFEGEAIGFDPYSGNFLPFQETVQRKRKYGIEEKAKEIPLKFFAFDLLLKNGKNYINEPFRQRRKELVSSIKTSQDVFKNTILVASEILTDDPKKLEFIFQDAVSKGLEGIVAKRLEGVYQPGARGWNWIKLKKSYASKIEDTIDCLVMGYDFGRGKRAGFGIGAFLAGVYDPKKDAYVTIAKIGTGLSDEEWKEMKKRCDKYKTGKKPALYDIDKQMNVDVWITPALVVEIRADEITRSSVHTAGRTLKKTKSGTALEVDTAGYALRFPRLERFRDDRKPDDATTLSELEKMYSGSQPSSRGETHTR